MEWCQYLDGVFGDTTTFADIDEFIRQFATFMVCVLVELQVVENVLGPIVAVLQFGVRHRESRLGIAELSQNPVQCRCIHGYIQIFNQLSPI